MNPHLLLPDTECLELRNSLQEKTHEIERLEGEVSVLREKCAGYEGQLCSLKERLSTLEVCLNALSSRVSYPLTFISVPLRGLKDWPDMQKDRQTRHIRSVSLPS